MSLRRRPSDSRGLKGYVQQGLTGFAVLQTIRENAKSQRLNAGDSVLPGLPIAHHPGESRHFCQPPAVFLSLQLYPESHCSSMPRVIARSDSEESPRIYHTTAFVAP